MNFLRLLLITCISFTSSLNAANQVLHVGIESFGPPFVMQGSNQKIYGFDVEMMNGLCKIMQRSCQFHIMRFNQLLNAVASKKLDVAVSSITITPERTKVVNFSLPYLLSYSRFLGRQSSMDATFSLALLDKKKIGLETGTIFLQQLNTMGVKNPNIKEYSSLEDQLAALSKGEVDIILLDNPTAIYWASNSSDTFKLLGPPYLYGYGLGIATTPGTPGLLSAINQALLHYQNSDDYKANYNRYLLGF